MTKLVISVDRPNLTDMQLDSRRKTFEYLLERLNVRFEVCEGSWAGDREQSYMITLDSGKYFRKLLEEAFDRFDQDAVLKISSYGGVRLVYLSADTKDGIYTEEPVGEWKEVDEIP